MKNFNKVLFGILTLGIIAYLVAVIRGRRTVLLPDGRTAVCRRVRFAGSEDWICRPSDEDSPCLAYPM